MGVVVRRHIAYSTCISSFFCSSIPTSLFILKNVFAFLYIVKVISLLYLLHIVSLSHV